MALGIFSNQPQKNAMLITSLFWEVNKTNNCPGSRGGLHKAVGEDHVDVKRLGRVAHTIHTDELCGSNRGCT